MSNNGMEEYLFPNTSLYVRHVAHALESIGEKKKTGCKDFKKCKKYRISHSDDSEAIKNKQMEITFSLILVMIHLSILQSNLETFYLINRS